MESLKGYGRVSDQENQIQSPSSRKTLIATISVVSVLLILSVVAAAAFTRPPVDSLKAVCAVTRYPKTCYDTLSTSLQSNQKLDPESILHLSIRLASKQASTLSLSFRSIDDMPEQGAIRDCVNLYNDAATQLNASLSEMEMEKNKLTESVVADVKTWTSAAMSDADTCSDGLEQMGSIVGKEIKKQMEIANHMMSITLAILAQINI